MPLSATDAAAAAVKPLPRALSLAGAAVAAATTSLILISVVVSRAHHSASSSSSSSPPPSSNASTAAPLPAPPTPSPVPEYLHHHPPPPPPIPPCPPNATHVVPCHEDDELSGERHCPPRPPPPPPPHPPEDPPPHPPHPPDHPPPPPPCRVPPPPGYRQPMAWPARRDRAWYANVELPPLAPAKLAGPPDPVRARGDWLVFPKGVGTYVEQLAGMVPLRGGEVRTALDVGCGVASFGDYLLNYGILTMSIDRRNRHKAQVQLALERGLPAMIGALGVRRLPYPTRSFDMVHCAGCLIPGNSHDELYMLEIDRLLRPGGYWVLAMPPISWKTQYDDLNRTAKGMPGEQLALEEIVKKLCWSKVSENGTIAVWRKPINHIQCEQDAKLLRSPPFCTGDDADSAWYVNTSMCLTRLPRDIAGGAVEKWPERLTAIPPRIASGETKGMPIQTYKLDSLDWKKRVDFYRTYLNLSDGSYRNVMDMNAGFGGFAAAMSEYPVWVMNVVPANLTDNTLGIIYERGLIGTYMDWCESFSTYPRTYDVLHANGVFSLYMDTCGIPYIMLEMDRILRPGGAAIIRDVPDVVHKVKDAADRLHWHSEIVDTENGGLDPEKLLIVDNSLPFPDHPA
ncbi:probable methyltransferase PMT19 [Oryza glaberrima]|nr:probable methyltransferase PMT19 [Oryza glaberrima]